MNVPLAFRRAAGLSALALMQSIAAAGSLTVKVGGETGAALGEVGVYAEPAVALAPLKTAPKAEIEQRARKFSPRVSIVQTGTEISFPNNDTVRHHVYSFSPAKIFDIKLYSAGTPGNPGPFDKAGTVVVGCNIHDQMVAYIHVVNTPYFAKTDAAGQARINGLPPGKYVLKAWHYNLANGAAIPEQTLIIADADATASFKLNVKAAITSGAAGY